MYMYMYSWFVIRVNVLFGLFDIEKMCHGHMVIFKVTKYFIFNMFTDMSDYAQDAIKLL